MSTGKMFMWVSLAADVSMLVYFRGDLQSHFPFVVGFNTLTFPLLDPSHV
jgi:hypothetical protein